MFILPEECGHHIAVLENLLTKFGVKHQLYKLQEELDELWDEIDHTAEDEEPTDNLFSEMADVIIMLEQMVMIYGSSRILEQIHFKLNRTRERLNSGEI